MSRCSTAPDGMGGEINLVTRKPAKPFEAEAQATLGLDRRRRLPWLQRLPDGRTRHDVWYAQGSYARNRQDHWDLPGGFVPTATENGGERDLSQTSDWRVNAKLGFTPNATDEYALSYTKQEGDKLAPLSTTDPLSSQRFWTWPYWNIASVYFLSTTALGDRVTLKTRLYRNTFDNLLRSFDNRNENTQTLGKAFNSYYQDLAYGGSAELDGRVADIDTLSLAFHYRRDKHLEWQQSFTQRRDRAGAGGPGGHPSASPPEHASARPRPDPGRRRQLRLARPEAGGGLRQQRLRLLSAEEQPCPERPGLSAEEQPCP